VTLKMRLAFVTAWIVLGLTAGWTSQDSNRTIGTTQPWRRRQDPHDTRHWSRPT
jgi:hypothetical protein